MHVTRLFVNSLLVVAWLLTGCAEETKVKKKIEPYKGPIEEISNVQMLYSEAALLKVKLTTPRQLRYQNDVRKYPHPLHLPLHSLTSLLPRVS